MIGIGGNRSSSTYAAQALRGQGGAPAQGSAAPVAGRWDNMPQPQPTPAPAAPQVLAQGLRQLPAPAPAPAQSAPIQPAAPSATQAPAPQQAAAPQALATALRAPQTSLADTLMYSRNGSVPVSLRNAGMSPYTFADEDSEGLVNMMKEWWGKEGLDQFSKKRADIYGAYKQDYGDQFGDRLYNDLIGGTAAGVNMEGGEDGVARQLKQVQGGQHFTDAAGKPSHFSVNWGSGYQPNLNLAGGYNYDALGLGTDQFGKRGIAGVYSRPNNNEIAPKIVMGALTSAVGGLGMGGMGFGGGLGGDLFSGGLSGGLRK